MTNGIKTFHIHDISCLADSLRIWIDEAAEAEISIHIQGMQEISTLNSCGDTCDRALLVWYHARILYGGKHEIVSELQKGLAEHRARIARLLEDE